MKILDANRLFPADGEARSVAARLYETVRELPIISPHGHTDPRWFAFNEPFPNPSALLIQPDHYIFRMLYSQGVPLESLGIPQLDGNEKADPREVWRIFARNYYLFRGTPTRLWLDYALENQFGLTKRLSGENADEYYEIIAKKLLTPEFRPRALFDKFNIEVLSTTDTPLDTLEYHKAIRESGWKGRIIPAFRPDSVIDAEYAGFLGNIEKLGEITGEDISTYKGYLNALRNRRAFFKSMGCTSTDHGHLTAMTADLDAPTAASLYGRILSGRSVPQEQEIFQAQMLT
jgi:glucuronate isomerase